MFRPRVIPCLLLQDKGLVKTIQFSSPTYIGDPINAVKIFNDARSDEIVFLDITASREKKEPDFALIEKIGDEAFMPFAVGGGVRNLEQVKRVISAGAEKVVLNSVCYDNPGLISNAAEIFGSQAIIASIDVKKFENGMYILFSHGGKKQESIDLVKHLEVLESSGAGEIFVNSIDRDGTMHGYDEVLIRTVCNTVSVPVIACGGASDIDDFPEMIGRTGASAAAAGSIFVFIGSKRAVLINYPEQEELFELFEEQ